MSLSTDEWEAMSELQREQDFEAFLQETFYQENGKRSRSYDKEWFGSYFDSDQDGVLDLNYGAYTDSQLVVLELANEVSVTPVFAFLADKPDPERDQILKTNCKKLIGCTGIGEHLTSLQQHHAPASSTFMHIQGHNGYSTYNVFNNELLFEYLLDDKSDVACITIYDPALILANRIGAEQNSVEEYHELIKEEPEAAEEYEYYLKQHSEEIEQLKQFNPQCFVDALKTIFRTPAESDIIAKSDDFTYAEPEVEEYEEEPDPRPEWLIKMEQESPDKLSEFFMNSDMSILEELDEKQYKVDSFEQLVAYRDELMAQPDRADKIKQTENAMLGKPKNFSPKKLRKAFFNEIGLCYDLERDEMPLDANFREIFDINDESDLHMFRQNIRALLRMETTMAHWDGVETIAQVIDKLQFLNENKDQQQYEQVPNEVNKLQMDKMKSSMEKQMAEMNKMMEDMFKEL